MSRMLNFADTGGLFDHFEVNREPFWPRIVCWSPVRALAPGHSRFDRDDSTRARRLQHHGNVQRRGICRSSLFSHRDGEDVDILDYSTEKFHYPEGYFAMDQQACRAAAVSGDACVHPASMSTTPSPSPTPTVTPTPPVLIAGNNGDANTTTGKSTERKPSPSVTPDDK